MTSRISNKFEQLQKKHQRALITYTMAGYPTIKDSVSVVKSMIKGGADIVELGFPFSDPLADGPTIQYAGNVALSNHIDLRGYFDIVKKIRKESDIPLVMMTYSNLLYRHGYQTLMKGAKLAGIDGFILPDMSVEECKDYVDSARNLNLDTIFLISPNTSKARIKKILKVNSGFLYLVSVYGTTGTSSKKNQDYTVTAVKQTKSLLKNRFPLAVGFGVSTPDDARRFIDLGADGVIVGSAIIKKVMENGRFSNKTANSIERFVKQLKQTTYTNRN